jgi:transcriptional regulator with XRE-family HTH domain
METRRLDGGKMRTRREKLGLSMNAAARVANLGGPQSWQVIEGGKRDNVTVDTLCAIAFALKCKPADLVARTPQPIAVKVAKKKGGGK